MLRILWYLSALWPLALLALPSVYDQPRASAFWSVAGDTTYASGVGVHKVAAISVAGMSAPDTAVVPSTTAMSVVPNVAGDSFLVFTYDTLTPTPMDSSSVATLWTAWGYSTPAPQDIPVPPRDYSSSLVEEFGMSQADSLAVVELVGFPYRDSVPFQDYWQIAKYDSLMDALSEYWWGDWIGDADTMASWWSANTNTTIDSLRYGALLNYHNYYDRALASYARWWRTGDSAWARRGRSYARQYAILLRDSDLISIISGPLPKLATMSI